MQKAKANQRLPEARGGEDCAGEIVKRYMETFRDDGYVYYLDHDNHMHKT